MDYHKAKELSIKVVLSNILFNELIKHYFFLSIIPYLKSSYL
jgi:hypothetical protein